MQLFYRSEGTGTPVVIIHGLYGSSDNWLTVAKKLAKILGYSYVDTGAMYRALTLKALRNKVNLENEA